MAYKRINVGSIVKKREGGDVLKLNTKFLRDFIDFLKNNQDKDKLYLSLESKKYQEDSLNAAVAAGKLSADKAEERMERIQKIPDFVRFEVVAVDRNDD